MVEIDVFRRLLVFALLFAAFSGCITEGDDEAESSEEGAGEEESEGDEEGGNEEGTEEAEALPPIAVIEVAVLDEDNHTYAFDATNSTDPEGGNLTFFWDFGDNETSMNASAEHTFDATGLSGNVTFNVTLTATDEEGLSDSENATVEFVAGPPKGVLYETAVVDFSGTLVVGAAGGNSCTTTSGVTCRTHVLPIGIAAMDGTAVEARTVRVLLDSTSATTVDADLFFNDPAGAQIDSAATGAPDEAIDYSVGKKDPGLAAGDYGVMVVNWAGVAQTYVVHVEIDYYTV